MLHVTLQLLFLLCAVGWLLLAVTQDEALLDVFFTTFGLPVVWRKGIVMNVGAVFFAGIVAVISGALVGAAAFACFVVSFGVRLTQLLTGRLEPSAFLRAGDWGVFLLVVVHEFGDEVLSSLLTLTAVLVMLGAIVYVSVRALRRVRY